MDALKAFWQRYGNLITWTLTLALAGFAGWTWWQRHQRDQAVQASTMYDELERVAGAGDAARSAKVFADLKERFGSTTYAVQGGLLAAKVQADKALPAEAIASLAWVAEHGDDEYKAIARLRWAGLLIDGKKYDDAIALLEQVRQPAFAALAADRKGDALLAKGQKDAAKAAYQAAWSGMTADVKYRFVVEAKLTALAAAPAASAAASAGAGQ